MNAESLPKKYERLAYELDDGDSGNFLSGWQCVNPFAEALLVEVAERRARLDATRYRYFDESEELIAGLASLHWDLDRARPEQILCGAGATGLIYAFLAFLRRKGVRILYYLPPLYFTIHAAAEDFGIDLRPVASNYAFERKFDLSLPESKGEYLLLSDPIWFAGLAVPAEVMATIRAWQERTGSFVFVDGSTQYMRWDGKIREESARLDPALTFRLISPSKRVAVHGFRFAYVLCPKEAFREYGWAYANINGPASCDALAFAEAVLPELSASTISRRLMWQAAQNHAELRSKNLIESECEPELGYFVFERISVPGIANKLMNGSYFDLGRFDNVTKINLLSPSIPHLIAAANGKA